MTRDALALRAPGDRELDGFPAWRLTARRALVRGHRTGNGPWWFSSRGGRFDLPAPRGTCYLALDAATAIRETVGEALVALGVIPLEFAEQRCLSTLHVPRNQELADTGVDAAADFGLTRELCTVTPYAVPQAWAGAFAARFDGLRYQSRFTTGSGVKAVGLFGPAGEADWPRDDAPAPLAEAAQRLGFAVPARPRSVRIVPPPI